MWKLLKLIVVSLIRELIKVPNDTLKNPKNGIYSRKSITALCSFIVAASYAFMGMMRGKEVQAEIVYAFLITCLTCLGISEMSKVSLKMPKDEQG